jgi:hypothetical protein
MSNILNRITYSYQVDNCLMTSTVDYSRKYPLSRIGAARIMKKDGIDFVSIHTVQTFVDER